MTLFIDVAICGTLTISCRNMANCLYRGKCMLYFIWFDIGDWSDDGHGKTQRYLVESSFPVERVREAHFKSISLLGFDIGDYRSDLDEDVSEKHLKALEAFGIDATCADDEFASDNALRVWLEVLNKTDPELCLKQTPDPFPSVAFYGFDDQGRHIKVPGYGAF